MRGLSPAELDLLRHEWRHQLLRLYGTDDILAVLKAMVARIEAMQAEGWGV